VLRYLNQFETMLAQARECDHMDVLGATFVTADVGKLYLILSNAVGAVEALICSSAARPSASLGISRGLRVSGSPWQH
jgi:hypothetical protein